MKKVALLIVIFTFFLFSFQEDKPAYKIFDSEGKEVGYNSMLEKIKEADIVFFGELHNNAIAHWMQYELTADLFKAKGEKLVLGAEMFEADNQLMIDEYLKSIISEEKFEDEAKLWPNYQTDYKPLLNFAKENKLPFIATNIPRRYAAVVYKEGFEGLEKLSDEAKKFIAPLPFEYDENLNCYKSMLEMGGMKKGMGAGNNNLPKAQAAKDATMAYFTLKNWEKGKTFLHFNGSYHSDNHESIVWYLKKKNKDLKIVTITTITQKDLTTMDESAKGTADFILVVPETMTNTY
ncbi:MAG: iron-regulated protein [Bacteroidetes bacterium GWF2_38_335]|nr:MAG: iron-regulated protein [Bacteroidetes bacterium GWF2_38_335]OFY80112.1 MAG: iron-regulated protein [Bacteroidetes bacterium RIFOXYA12_FULL_38_20]HBS88561.1 iron-regulated protein [Bacteroidales bacterium]